MSANQGIQRPVAHRVVSDLWDLFGTLTEAQHNGLLFYFTELEDKGILRNPGMPVATPTRIEHETNEKDPEVVGVKMESPADSQPEKTEPEVAAPSNLPKTFKTA